MSEDMPRGANVAGRPCNVNRNSELPWKPAIFGRIRAALRGSQHHVMEALVRLSGPDGRCWVAMATLANDARVDVKTARKHVHALVEAGGFLQTDSMTWAQLCVERRAAGRPVPRTDNERNAPYLFTVLDGLGRRASELPEAERRQRFAARWGQPPRPGQGGRRRVSSEPKARVLGASEGYQIWEGQGLPNLVADLSIDPTDQELSVHAPEVEIGQHTFFVSSSKGEEGPGHEARKAYPIVEAEHLAEKVGELEAWNVIVDAHVEKTKAVYGLPPLPPDLKSDQQRALAECLDGAATDVRAKLHERTGIERESTEVRRELAARVMNLYFKRDNDHLRRVKHALRDLPREFHARLTEAMQALLRESHEAAPPPPRRPQLEQPPERIESVEVTEEMPVKRAEIPADLTEHIIAAREANRFVRALSTAPGEVMSRPSALPMSERSKAPAPSRPPRNEARPALSRPESVRSGPRWGEVASRRTIIYPQTMMSTVEQPAPKVEQSQYVSEGPILRPDAKLVSQLATAKDVPGRHDFLPNASAQLDENICRRGELGYHPSS